MSRVVKFTDMESKVAQNQKSQIVLLIASVLTEVNIDIPYDIARDDNAPSVVFRKANPNEIKRVKPIIDSILRGFSVLKPDNPYENRMVRKDSLQGWFAEKLPVDEFRYWVMEIEQLTSIQYHTDEENDRSPYDTVEESVRSALRLSSPSLLVGFALRNDVFESTAYDSVLFRNLQLQDPLSNQKKVDSSVIDEVSKIYARHRKIDFVQHERIARACFNLRQIDELPASSFLKVLGLVAIIDSRYAGTRW